MMRKNLVNKHLAQDIIEIKYLIAQNNQQIDSLKAENLVLKQKLKSINMMRVSPKSLEELKKLHVIQRAEREKKREEMKLKLENDKKIVKKAR